MPKVPQVSLGFGSLGCQGEGGSEGQSHIVRKVLEQNQTDVGVGAESTVYKFHDLEQIPARL